MDFLDARAAAVLPDEFDGPDNVYVSPWGGLVIAEDGEGLNGLIFWTSDGGAQRFARNDILFQGSENAEMTGPPFPPDGSILFANVPRTRPHVRDPRQLRQHAELSTTPTPVAPAMSQKGAHLVFVP